MSIREKHLKILGLSANASKSEVKKAYRKLSKKYHPDISQNPNATEKFIEIDRAYDFLTNSKQVEESHIFKNQDNTPKETEYEKWKRNARERQKQAAHEKNLYQLKLTRKINLYSRVFIIPLFLFNLILTLDWFLPKISNERNIIGTSQVYERSKRSSYYSYDKISFEQVSILVKKGGAAKASKFSTGIITTTRILGLPRYCQFSADKAFTLQHILGVYDTFWILIPTVVILSLYFFKPKISAGNKLSVSCILFFIFFFQAYIFFATA